MARMTRSDFVACCALGACACALPAVAIAETPGRSADSELDWVKSQLEAARIRYAKLVGILDANLDDATKKKVFDSLGRECARQFRSMTYEKYRGNIKGFLQMARGPEGWATEAEYDEAKGVIRIVDRARNCSCPLAKKDLTPASQCLCTLGWQRETYSAILGKPVEAELEESILRGGTKCVFRITVV